VPGTGRKVEGLATSMKLKANQYPLLGESELVLRKVGNVEAASSL
jgi:hypothetical protein